MLKAVFFDLDGTLLDTLPNIRAHVNMMLRAFHYPEITEMQTRAFIGNGARPLIERSLPAGATNFEECFRYYSECCVNSDNAHTKPYGGAVEALKTLKKRGVKLAVVTNKRQLAAERCLKQFFPEGTFDFVGGDSGMFDCKPDPSLTRYAALTLRVAPKECVFVGDGETDVLTAKNAGMRSVSVLWGYRSREELEKAGAREFVSSYEELIKLLEIF